MSKALNRATGPVAAAWLCWSLSLSAVSLAFLGSERAGAFMALPVMQAGVALLTWLFGFVGARAVLRRRFDSALLHTGCACVLAGWLMGRHAVRTATSECPCTGSMVMVDGEESDRLWEGPMLDRYVGRLPFSVRLERFFVERYVRNSDDRDAGRDAPVREYRSRVTITEPGRTPYVANVRVNEPVSVRGYHIYQMSWGHSTDRMGQPIVYTVLQVIRDPGLRMVYAGFTILFAGILLFAGRVFRIRGRSDREVPA